MLLKITALSWGLLFSILAFSQELTQTIRGRVLDSQTRQPLIGATVTVLNSEPLLGAITDIEGHFRIPSVPIGRHTIQITSIGYETQMLPELLVGSGKQLVLTIDLTESVLEMNEVVVTAESAKGQPQNELVSVSAISIGVEETSRFAATFDDPARAALSYAGVATGGDDLTNEIVIRGNSPKGILWRLEGVEIPNPNHFSSLGSSAGGISMLSSNMLATSDFFTGAFSSQYGNATSGIFDLRLRKGNSEAFEHGFEAGLLGVAATSEGPIGSSGSSYLVNYRYSTLALFDQVGIDVLGEQEDVVFQDLSFNVVLPKSGLGSFRIWGLGGMNAYTFRPNLDFGETFYDDESQSMGVAGVTHVAYLGKNTFIESVLSASATLQKNDEDSLRVLVTGIQRVEQNAYRASSFINHKFNARHALRVGGIYSRLQYDLRDTFWSRQDQVYRTPVDEKGKTNFYQGYANWQYRPSAGVTINSGVHASYFSLNDDLYIEPRLGLQWRSGRWMYSFGAGLHSRMETLALYASQQQQADGSYVQNNRDLGFTKAAHLVLGAQKQLSTDLRLRAELYYQHLYDVPIWPEDTTDMFLTTLSVLNTFDGYTSSRLVNEGTGRNYGLELTLEKFFTQGYYFLSTASLYQSKYTAIDGIERNTRFNGSFIVNLVGGKEYAFSRQRKLNINSRIFFAGGKRQAPIDVPASIAADRNVFDFSRNYDLLLNNYFRLDLGISYRKDREKTASIVSLNVQNIFSVPNEFERYYSSEVNGILSAEQQGFLPNLSYRIVF